MLKFTPVGSELQKRLEQGYEESPFCNAMSHALSRQSVLDASCNNQGVGSMSFCFSNEIETLPVSNQKASGRCWIFAGLNVLRERIAHTCNMDLSEPFELSQNYTAFWDKFEKINYFLETILHTLDRDADDRALCYVLSVGLQDGGQWDMFANTVRKYGVVPKNAMPETFQSSNTAAMNKMASCKLRLCAAQLRKMHQEGASEQALQAKKETMLADFYQYLCMCFGQPPKKVTFEYKDRDKAFHREADLSPQAFFDRYIGNSIDEYISVIQAPTPDKPYNCTYTVEFLGSVVEGSEIRYLNLPMEEFETLILKQIKDGEVVWFGSDVGKFGDRALGVWDDGSFDFETTLGMDFTMTKEEQLIYRDSCMTHAMVLTGVNLEHGKPNRWKIENSWGDERGCKGYYVCSGTWFDRYAYQAVVHKKYLNERQRAALAKEPIVLNPWDPMGSLAD